MSTNASGMLATAYYSLSQHVIAYDVVQDVQTVQASSDYIMTEIRRRMRRIQCGIAATAKFINPNYTFWLEKLRVYRSTKLLDLMSQTLSRIQFIAWPLYASNLT